MNKKRILWLNKQGQIFKKCFRIPKSNEIKRSLSSKRVNFKDADAVIIRLTGSKMTTLSKLSPSKASKLNITKSISINVAKFRYPFFQYIKTNARELTNSLNV